MSKYLKITYILFFIFSAIMIAWNTFSNFFGGVGINFVALLGIVFVVVLIMFNNKEVVNRTKDLLIVASSLCVLELIIYFACEYGYGEFLKGFIVYQNILSFLGILFFSYIAFRFTTDFLGKKIKFIEIMLGNEKRRNTPKKAKEVSNGSLEEKPTKKAEESKNIVDSATNTDDEEVEIIISEDEE